MNISSIGSVSWYTSLTSTSNLSGSGGKTSASASTTDSACFSAAGFAALLSEQGGGPPAISDDQAAQIGSTLQGQNADLFSALDSDGNGTLSADELKTAMKALHGSQGRPSGPPPSGPPPEMSDDQASAIGSDLLSSNTKLFSALDTNQDGTLSADELKTGMDSLHQAMEANGVGPPAPPSGGQDAGQSGDILAQLLASAGSSADADYQTNLMNELLKGLSGTAAA